MRVKEESEKADLKLNIQKTKIMASGPITSQQIDGERMETVTDFIFLGFKVTADGDCSHEIKRHLLLGRKAMTNLESILKSRGITLPKSIHLVKAMVFPVVMYGYEFSSVTQSCPTLCDPTICSTPGLPIHHQLPVMSSLKLMSIQLVMPSSHLILCRPLLLLPLIPPSIRVFSNESTLRMRWPKYWSFSFSISPSNEHPGLISFRKGF